ncbi:trans-sulfuration enzyme family protein [Streptomyces sp. NPDC091377]|uniref:trans-sulfuration enzyme family protein n=1 Tax=Streptomyces sp. NPDC091377 TaxID=3365995 RepID=UPI00381B8A42
MPGSSTVTVHADRTVLADHEVPPGHAVAPPIYQTAAFSAPDAETFTRAAVERRGQDFYTRFGNPNHAQVAAVVAELEGTEAAMVTASGMAALTTAVLALVSSGDHVIGQRSTYGGTASVLLNLLPRLGVTTTLVDQTDPAAFEQALTSRTRLILVESPSNPLLQITDLRAVADLARAHDVLTLADNTFATPLNQRPADFGIDLVWHSATKYLNGHADVSAGVLAGPAGLLDRIWDVGLLTGAVLGPFDAWLLLRGLRTLALRVPRHNDNGQALAEALHQHPAVRRVHYPGLPSHPQHRLAAQQMSGFGGVLGIEFADGFETADAFLGRLRYARRAASLGGVETLAVHPASLWRGMLDQDQFAGAIPPGLIRLAAGTEDTADLVTDALAAADAASTGATPPTPAPPAPPTPPAPPAPHSPGSPAS